MAQEISAGFHHRPDKTLHFVRVVAQLSFGYGHPAKRHFELAFDIGEQAHALSFATACSGTGSGLASMLPASSACRRIGSRPIGIITTSLSGSNPPAASIARVEL